MGLFTRDKKVDEPIYVETVVGDNPQFVKPLAEHKAPRAAALLVGGTSGAMYVQSYTGEKNLGEMGPAIDYRLNYDQLRVRSWQAYLESDIAQTILKKFTLWVIDTGLRLKSSPSKLVFPNESEAFNEQAEMRFNVWSKSKKASYNGMSTLNDLAKDCFKNAKIGGDCLVVLRYIDGIVKVQLIDGAHVSSPLGGISLDGKIRDGVEVDENGKHIAYHVCTALGEYERIPAVGAESGFVTAFLVYGLKYRLDSMRGMPVIATCLETIKKIERYKEAAVGSAEERQKIVYQIVHGAISNGESPLVNNLAKAFNVDNNDADLPVDYAGQQLSNSVAASTNKQTINMTPGAKLEALESRNELFFKEFYSTNADIICAAVGIPPNVAWGMYTDSFSASRAATKDWDHTIIVERDDFQTQFYQNIYNFWLYIEILKNNIQAPGYIIAQSKGDVLTVEAYQICRFTGPLFPHIDPLKEAKAEREKLGTLGAHIPLVTVEQAVETLSGGDSDSTMEQFAAELEYAEELGIEQPEPVVPGALPVKKEDPIEAEDI